MVTDPLNTGLIFEHWLYQFQYQYQYLVLVVYQYTGEFAGPLIVGDQYTGERYGSLLVCVCVCVFIKFHITAQPGPVKLIFQLSQA